MSKAHFWCVTEFSFFFSSSKNCYNNYHNLELNFRGVPGTLTPKCLAFATRTEWDRKAYLLPASQHSLCYSTGLCASSLCCLPRTRVLSVLADRKGEIYLAKDTIFTTKMHSCPNCCIKAEIKCFLIEFFFMDFP